MSEIKNRYTVEVMFSGDEGSFMKQKAILTFTDNNDGTLGINMEFEPEVVTDETISNAVSCAVKCMEYITDVLSGREVQG